MIVEKCKYTTNKPDSVSCRMKHRELISPHACVFFSLHKARLGGQEASAKVWRVPQYARVSGHTGRHSTELCCPDRGVVEEEKGGAGTWGALVINTKAVFSDFTVTTIHFKMYQTKARPQLLGRWSWGLLGLSLAVPQNEGRMQIGHFSFIYSRFWKPRMDSLSHRGKPGCWNNCP